MSGPRPVHLTRRGAIYAVRFRVPADLVTALGIVELRRSLFTADPALARRRCASTTAWFDSLMQEYRRMKRPTRKDFEEQANRYFNKMLRDLDLPRDFSIGYIDMEAQEQLEMEIIWRSSECTR
jgi:hypothetical protein